MILGAGKRLFDNQLNMAIHYSITRVTGRVFRSMRAFAGVGVGLLDICSRALFSITGCGCFYMGVECRVRRCCPVPEAGSTFFIKRENLRNGK